ncbi:hypothetical protein BDR26DRAFT_873497 [Obelidium mucronatum]|nr:hypothetical protein BDR26DRAFT_873497 [Obelidium mucronatum]
MQGISMSKKGQSNQSRDNDEITSMSTFLNHLNANVDVWYSLPWIYKAVLYEQMFLSKNIWRMENSGQATTPRNHLLDLNDGILFRWACSCGNLRLVIKGHAAVVALLLQKYPQVDPSSDHDFASRRATFAGATSSRPRRVCELRAVVRREERPRGRCRRAARRPAHSRTLRIAARNGHSEVVRVLLNDKRVDAAAAAAIKRESLFSFIGSLFWPSVN